jgi:peptide/nickel transport system ATP-binding protein
LRSRPQAAAERLLEVKGLKVYFPIQKGLFRRTVGVVKAVDGVSFSITRGKTLALVGESGSGKSTIGQAILRLLDITEGEIRFRGVDLAALDEKRVKPYRSRIQVVFQDPYSALNPRMTIGEIIREGMVSLQTGPSGKQAQAHHIAALLKKVGLEPEHLHRYPHEFSGGQRQRIAIARAFLKDAPILILDEATSALDSETEQHIQVALDRLMQNRTTLVIAHRLSTIERADTILVMDAGAIVEKGTHTELLARGGYYARLYRMQFKELEQ